MSLTLDRLIETRQLAQQLLAQHGDPSLAEQGWTFEFSNKRREIGTCRYNNKVINVSKWYIDSHPDQIKDTILHEIAHALTFERYGGNHGHNHAWRMMCIEVGANPTRTTDLTDQPSVMGATFNGNYNYTVSCQNPDCPKPWTAGKFRIKQAYYRYHCKWCKGPITIIDHKTGNIYLTEVDGINDE
jgi:predicted SprT family Zn-dependent metalloprotease